MRIPPLSMPMRIRPIDEILLALVAMELVFSVITYAELSDLRRVVHGMELNGTFPSHTRG